MKTSSAALEGRYVLNSGKQLRSGVMQERRLQEVCLLQCLCGNTRRTPWTLHV